MSLTRRRLLELGGSALIGVGISRLASAQTVRPAQLYLPPRGDVRLLVISDLNEAYGSTTYSAEVTQAIALIPQWQPDVVLCSGDMVAGQSNQLSDAQIRAMWAGFDRAIASPLRQAGLPYGFTLGNHDASRSRRGTGYAFQRDRSLAAAYWNDPTHNPGLQFVDRNQFPFYYSFQNQGIFYLVWDASSGLRMPAEDLAWVERSLASPVAQQAPLRIVIGHLPLYAVAVDRDRPGEVMDGAAELHALLEQYHVHTYISGHQHAYYPGHLGKLNFLHTGALGAGPRRLLAGNLAPRKTLTVVDINRATATTTYTTYVIPSLQVINQQELPRTITSHNGIVVRRDLNWNQLTAQEQQACLQRLPSAHCST